MSSPKKVPQPRWQQIEPPLDATLPPARRNQTVVAIQRKLYLFGGLAHGGNTLNDLWEFDAAESLSWSQVRVKGNLPGKRHNHTAVTWRNKMYIFGGDSGSQFLNDVWEFDPSSPRWKKVSIRGVPPKGRYGHASCIVGAVMYVHGGFAGGQLSDLWSFNLSTKTWSKVSVADGPRPSKRSFHRAVPCPERNSFVCVFGTSGRTQSGELWEFFPQRSTWERVNISEDQKPPRPRSHHSVAVSGDSIVVYGGTDGDRKEDLWIYSLSSHRWTMITPKFRNVHYPSGTEQFKPGVREGHSVTIVGNDLLVIGGVSVGALASAYHNDVWVLDMTGILQNAIESSYVPQQHIPDYSSDWGSTSGGHRVSPFQSPAASDLSLEVESETPTRSFRKRSATLSVLRRGSSPNLSTHSKSPHDPSPSLQRNTVSGGLLPTEAISTTPPRSPLDRVSNELGRPMRHSPKSAGNSASGSPARRASMVAAISSPSRSPSTRKPRAQVRKPDGGSLVQGPQLQALLAALEQRFKHVEKQGTTAAEKVTKRVDLLSRALQRLKKDVSDQKEGTEREGRGSRSGADEGRVAAVEDKLDRLERVVTSLSTAQKTPERELVTSLNARIVHLEELVESQAVTISKFERTMGGDQVNEGGQSVTTSQWKHAVMTRMNALEACITAQQEAIVNLELLLEQELANKKRDSTESGASSARRGPEGRPPKTPSRQSHA